MIGKGHVDSTQFVQLSRRRNLRDAKAITALEDATRDVLSAGFAQLGSTGCLSPHARPSISGILYSPYSYNLARDHLLVQTKSDPRETRPRGWLCYD